MSIIKDIVDGEAIKAMVNSYVATLSDEDKELAKKKSEKLTNFIEKFPKELMLIVYKDAKGNATAMLPNKDIIRFHTDKTPETYNLTEILNEAIGNL